MRHLRLFSVLLLLSFAFTGCHRRRERIVPPARAQAPIVTTLPPIPPLTFPDVQLAKAKPRPLVIPQIPPEKPLKVRTEKVRRHHAPHKAESASAARTAQESPDTKPATSEPPGKEAPPALGQLSADDASTSPSQNVETKQLIQETEDRLNKISTALQEKHKDDIAQVASFLAQAKQAWAMNDVTGAETLANKAKILLDDLLK